MQDECFSHHSGGGFLCQIIRRRTKSSCQENQIGTGKRRFQGCLQPCGIVADDRLIIARNSECGKLSRKKRRIGVDDITEQKLCADRNDFRCCILHRKTP